MTLLITQLNKYLLKFWMYKVGVYLSHFGFRCQQIYS